MKCRLYISTNKGNKCVATAFRFPSEPDMLVHSVPLRDGCAKVQIDCVNKNCLNMPLPVEEREIATLGEAVRSFVQWPVNLIRESGKVLPLLF